MFPKHIHTHARTYIHHSHMITEMLEASPVWSAYKDQKHDLFISDTTVSGYLTGPTGVAGYLTAGTSTSAPLTALPPLKEPPDDTQVRSCDWVSSCDTQVIHMRSHYCLLECHQAMLALVQAWRRRRQLLMTAVEPVYNRHHLTNILSIIARCP